MAGETGAAPRRVPLSPLSPRPRVRLTALADGELAFDVLCAVCQRYHLALAVVADAGPCHRADFRPAGAAAFVATHAHNLADDYPDHGSVAALSARARAGLLATTDARTAAGGPDPVDLL